MEKQIYFLGFYTSGEDGSSNLHSTAIEVKNKISKYFTQVFLYDKKTLKKLPNSEDICNVHNAPGDVRYFPFAHKMGYYDWKPFLINHTLKTIPQNSILLYHDINFDKYKGYWFSDWENIYDVCEKFLADNQSDIWAKFDFEETLLKNSMKISAIDKIFTNPEHRKVVRNSYQINAGQVILRNTLFAQEFAKDWLDYSKDYDIIHPPSNLKDSNVGCNEQDAMQCAIYKRILDGRLNPSFPKYKLRWRVLRHGRVKFSLWGEEQYSEVCELRNKAILNYFKVKQ